MPPDPSVKSSVTLPLAGIANPDEQLEVAKSGVEKQVMGESAGFNPEKDSLSSSQATPVWLYPPKTSCTLPPNTAHSAAISPVAPLHDEKAKFWLAKEVMGGL